MVVVAAVAYLSCHSPFVEDLAQEHREGRSVVSLDLCPRPEELVGKHRCMLGYGHPAEYFSEEEAVFAGLVELYVAKRYHLVCELYRKKNRVNARRHYLQDTKG